MSDITPGFYHVGQAARVAISFYLKNYDSDLLYSTVNYHTLRK